MSGLVLNGMMQMPMISAIFLFLPFIPCVFMDEGAVVGLGVIIDDDAGTPVHTWVMRDPSNSKSKDRYKLECLLSKSDRHQYIVKVYFQDTLLETMKVSRFDDDMLDSVRVFKRDKEGRHRIRYQLTEESGGACYLRTYELNDGGGFKPADKDCSTGVLSSLWEYKDAGRRWRWDEDSLKRWRRPRGVVKEIGLKDITDSGVVLHTWTNRLYGFGYTMNVSRTDVDGEVNYYATVSYHKAIVDIVKVNDLGDLLTHSITVLGMNHNNKHIIQYKKTDRKCIVIYYPKTLGEDAGEGVTTWPPKPHRCLPVFFKKVHLVMDNFFSSHRSDNGWNW